MKPRDDVKYDAEKMEALQQESSDFLRALHDGSIIGFQVIDEWHCADGWVTDETE